MVWICCVFSPSLVWGIAEGKADTSWLRVHEVGRLVADFPEEEDLSTPESAYAAINRILVRGEPEGWRRISTKETQKRLSSRDGESHPLPAEKAKKYLQAKILEVRVFRGIHAGIIARLATDTSSTRYDIRYVDLEEGKWHNVGEDIRKNIEAAREVFARTCSKYVEKTVRGPLDDPQAYLAPFVQFLREHGEQPETLVMEALARHRVTIMGEIHHRPRYWAFNASLVRHPEFPRRVGTIYMELPIHAQSLVDSFLAAEELDTALVIEMLRDMMWMGWPDQAMLDFFVAVWEVNQTLPSSQRLRIMLADMPRPYKKIRKWSDWEQYEPSSRNRFMAEKIIEDLADYPHNRRHAFFIVGVGHAPLNLFAADQTTPIRSAGWYLRQELGGEQVYVIAPHRPIMSNWGTVYGRVGLGLFEAAFAELKQRPIAFSLNQSPFGELPLDVDTSSPPGQQYRDAYSAYLYLGPLEDEIFAPLIEGFYTDEFVQELDRRFRLRSKRSWAEVYGYGRMSADNFIAWMSNDWGQPRNWTRFLGPTDAWHYGDEWQQMNRGKQHTYAFEHPQVIADAARAFFDLLRQFDYRDPLKVRRGVEDIYYNVYSGIDTWSEWVCATFKENPIKTVEFGEVFACTSDLPRIEVKYVSDYPTIPYKATLADGHVLEGYLPFEYQPLTQTWMGQQGLDWHREIEMGP